VLNSPTTTGQTLFAQGSATVPSIAFVNDGAPDTGLYHLSDGVFGVTCNSLPVVIFKHSGAELLGIPLLNNIPAQGNSSSAIASTSFAMGMGLRVNGSVGLVADTTLTSADFGRLVFVNTADPTTLTLPSIAASGPVISVSNIGSGTCTIAKSDAAQIYGKGKNNVSSVTLLGGESISLVSDGGNWIGLTGGFTAVEQGGGAGQSDNKLRLGWSDPRLRLSVNNTDVGALVSESIALSSGTDLNTIVTSGFYRLNTGLNFPDDSANYSQLIVSRGGDTITQIVSVYGTGTLWTRSGNPVQTGSTGVYSPWRQMYASNNIVGVVSQSGFVPTGAIIERGGNANGEYTRWADGTQICFHNMPTPLANTVYNWAYPASFVGLRVFGTKDTSPANGSYVCSNGTTLTSTGFFVGVGGDTANLSAIGRWY
jgi:hypothetical protein